jgi:hypothetical protein
MKKIFGGTVVILIALAMVFSSFAFAVNTNTLQASTKVQGSVDSSQIKGNFNRDPIVWDNGGIDGTSNGLSSQLDPTYFNSQVADDFQLEADTLITDVHWWGVFWNGPPAGPNPADFNIIFYADAGGMPTGAGMPDPTPTALKVYNMSQVLGVPTGGVEEYEYDVVLPEPFPALANEIYWIAIQCIVVFPPQWGWETNGANPEFLSIPVQGFPLLAMPYWTATQYGDMAFYLTGIPEGPPPKPAICCNGTLTWPEVNASATVTGTFQVCNCGDIGSLLNWQVDTWPPWGTWTFNPPSGAGLAKNDCATITVQVIAPPTKKKTFIGTVKIINSDNESDFCEIDVSLTTPRAINGFTLLQWILQKYPNMFPILRIILA